ncbi:MAG: hypothetical protein ISQ34_01055 [Rickettsiales bacterium]|nr:hypothetical protein [Rickettsiales bacterium]
MIFDFKSDFKSRKIRYAIFIGRFQPFLKRTHFEYCLKGILKCGLKPILLFGSANESVDFEKFNPLNNPLNNQQRLRQFAYVRSSLRGEEQDKIGFAGFLDDKFDNNMWFKSLIDKLENYFFELDNGDSINNAVFFRVGKDADLDKDERLNATALSHFDEIILNSSFAGVMSPQCSEELLSISATNFRRKNVTTMEFQNNVIACDYIKELIMAVRNNTSWGRYFNEINLDLTMLDLALYRFIIKMNLDENIILDSDIKSVENLEEFLTKLLIK